MPLFRHASDGIAPLVPIPPIAELPPAKLQASARYLGTLDADGNRVIGQSLSAKSAARLSLSAEGIDVVRIAGSFRIRPDALDGARPGERFNGKAVDDLLVIRWQHDGREWETGFRLDAARSVRDAAKAQLGKGRQVPAADVGAWVRTISKLARESKGNS
ncbi:hypothetical protein EFK50_06085 [Nocardioides marmoriginsengisoli]|uniref:PH domain-containing protein n=1 Tax=Nocardioides marmoriginsengisoli TaxID=661483 RepID=A0A3N0CL91_9ACTN|nr:hypothetical protein [Nocardioides marmoriginsengisoli]RNL64109.1 hypothetical protein EFK50_06085 [Nocardioides marmoriginsengisoli]